MRSDQSTKQQQQELNEKIKRQRQSHKRLWALVIVLPMIHPHTHHRGSHIQRENWKGAWHGSWRRTRKALFRLCACQAACSEVRSGQGALQASVSHCESGRCPDNRQPGKQTQTGQIGCKTFARKTCRWSDRRRTKGRDGALNSEPFLSVPAAACSPQTTRVRSQLSDLRHPPVEREAPSWVCRPSPDHPDADVLPAFTKNISHPLKVQNWKNSLFTRFNDVPHIKHYDLFYLSEDFLFDTCWSLTLITLVVLGRWCSELGLLTAWN